MKKLIILFSLLLAVSSHASEFYKCELTRESASGVDQQNVKTGWLKADTVGNILNLDAISGVSGVAIVTNAGLKVSLCDEIKCTLSDSVQIGEYQGISTAKLYDSFRVSIECYPVVEKSNNNCMPNCHSQWNTCLDGCRNLPSDDINSCNIGCKLGYDYCRARCN